jgi:hypothetical protein
MHHLADPALAARLLGLSRDSLLDGDGTPVGPQPGSMLGHLFESLVTLCVRVPAQAAEANLARLRTRNATTRSTSSSCGTTAGALPSSQAAQNAR